MKSTSDLDMKALKTLLLSDINNRRDLSRKLGISKSAAGVIVKQLIKNNLVAEAGCLDEPRRGRKTIALKPRQDIAYFLGTEIGSSSIRACILDSNIRVIANVKHAIGSDWKPRKIKQQWQLLLKDVIDSAGVTSDKIAAIGVGLPGRVAADGTLNSHALLGTEPDIDASFMPDHYRGKALAANNAFCICEYERRLGPAGNADSFMAIIIRYGLGVAIFSNNAYLVGNRHRIGELGHMKIQDEGSECICGQRGCLDTFVSGRRWQAIDNFCEDKLQRELSARAEFLAVGLANLLKLVNVRLVVIDGIYNEYYSYFKPPLLDSLKQQLAGLGLPIPEIVFGDQLQFKASIGAAMLAADRFLEAYLAEKYCSRSKT